MPKFIPRTNAQNKAIHSLLNQFNFDRDSKAEMVFDITNGRTESSGEMSFDEANVMIRRLGGRAFDAPNQFRSRRTENYHKQKAGIQTIPTSTHVDLMRSRAHRRGITPDGLGDLSARVNGGNRHPKTSKEVSRVIEAIKAMDARDKKKSQSEKQEAA